MIIFRYVDANMSRKRPRTTATSPQSHISIESSIADESLVAAKKINVDALKSGAYITTINQYRVAGVREDAVRLIDASGLALSVSRDIIEGESIAASQYTKTEVLTMTAMEQAFKDIGPGVVFTVRFIKKADIGQSFESLRTWFQEKPELLQVSFDDYDRKSKTAARKAYMASSTGPVRILTGYKKTHSNHVHAEDVLGRAKVVDLHLANPGPSDSPSDRDTAYPERLVDYRTIKELIVNGTLYVLRGEKSMLTESGKAY